MLEEQLSSAKAWKERTSKTFLKKNSLFTLSQVSLCTYGLLSSMQPCFSCTRVATSPSPEKYGNVLKHGNCQRTDGDNVGITMLIYFQKCNEFELMRLGFGLFNCKSSLKWYEKPHLSRNFTKISWQFWVRHIECIVSLLKQYTVIERGLIVIIKGISS